MRVKEAETHTHTHTHTERERERESMWVAVGLNNDFGVYSAVLFVNVRLHPT